MKKITSPLIISSLFLIIAFVLNSLLIQSTLIYKETKEELAEALSYKKRFLNGDEWEPIEGNNDKKEFDYKDQKLAINIAFGSSEEQKTVHQNLQTKIDTAASTVYSKAFWVLLAILIYGLIMLGISIAYKPPSVLLIGLISISIVCLHAGLFTPMLEIGAIERDFNLGDIPIQKEVYGVMVNVTIQKKFEGDIYFYYQSKSITQLIQLLFDQKNFLVGFSILLFSVIFPILKTTLMTFFVFRPQIANKKWFKNFVLNLSKWSMADVFVVAIFLGFLAFGNLQTGIGTYSETSIGLYFFFTYCMLSIISSMLAKMPTEEVSS